MAGFIKIHPHYLMLIRTSDEVFSGELNFSMEQYGLILKQFNLSVELTPPNEHYEHWRFLCDDPGQLNVPSFAVFLKSMEHYIFVTLKFSPHEASHKDAHAGKHKVVTHKTQPFHLHFDEMFFDIGDGSLTQAKKTD